MNNPSFRLILSWKLIKKVAAFSVLGFYLAITSMGCQSLYRDQSYGQVDWTHDLSANGIMLDWPVDDATMTRGYLPKKRSRPHLGLDLAGPKGTPILAAHDGVVVYTGKEFRGFGKMILIEGRGGWATLYAHLDRISVSEGIRVRKGQVIGKMGRTGRASGVHLHFELRKNKGPVDPLLYLPAGTQFATK